MGRSTCRRHCRRGQCKRTQPAPLFHAPPGCTRSPLIKSDPSKLELTGVEGGAIALILSCLAQGSRDLSGRVY
jgi:hypothetical protein